MNSILLVLTLFEHCPKPVLINIRPKHRIDQAVLLRAPVKCKLLYENTSPCLYKLERLEDSIAFNATCGAKKDL